MSENKNIKTFSAADIEKYWKGQLSVAEMHAIERAAMEDSFLADAMEGFKNTATASEDIRQLKHKLDERISGKTKVIPIGSAKIKWLRVAAAVIIVGGLGVLTQQLFFRSKNNEMTLVNKEKSAKQESSQTAPIITNDTTKFLLTPAEDKTEKPVVKLKTSKVDSGIMAINKKREIEKEFVESGKNPSSQRDSVEKSIALVNADAKSLAPVTSSADPSAKPKPDNKNAKEELDLEEVTVVSKRQAVSEVYKNAGAINLNYHFNYRVVDAENNPVPFANVSNTKDGIGTYTDMNGYFTLVSSDSVMDVRVKSLGLTTSTFKLNPSQPPHALVMQEDEKFKSSILANNRKMISGVVRKDTAELEEPEVGWEYYNTYIANNLKIPENLHDKRPMNNVELSFDVDKNGQPINIKIIKSSECKTCDEEAIRLLKEGPKWKRKGKKTKTSIAIAVNQ